MVIPASRTSGTTRAARPVRAERSWVLGASRAVIALAVLLVVATLVLLGLTWTPDVPALAGSHLQDTVLTVAFLAYSLVGALIVARQPENRIGWVFLATGLVLHLWPFAARYAAYGLVVQPGSLPATELVAWVSLWIGVAGLGLSFAVLPPLLPDGSLPARGFRLVTWFAGLAVGFALITWATDPGPMGMFGAVSNPVGIAAVGRYDLPGMAWTMLFLAVLASAASLVIRFIRSGGTQRRQLQWFAYAAAVAGATLLSITVASVWEPADAAAELLFPLAIAALPTAAFLAIFKYQLYDLQVVVSKTIAFGVLAAAITALYVAVIAGVGSTIGAAAESNVILAVLATAVLAVLFQPARMRVYRFARHIVYGERAAPYDVLAEFAHRIGGAPNVDEVLPQLARLLAAATGADRTQVWLVVGAEVRLAASWPTGQERRTLPMADDGRLPPLPDMSESVEVRHQGRLLGAINLSLPAGRSLTVTEQRLFADLAAQAGLVMDNIRLIEELKASRERIVTAQDRERRKLERNIHDGAQQRLMALALALRRQASEATSESNGQHSDPLGHAADEVLEILAELRALARGIHPAIVAGGGLVAALESLAQRSPVPVEIRSTGATTAPDPVEITVYYLVAEAVANTIKHAEASAVAVSVDVQDGAVRVEVADDGVGGAVASGSGLTGLADRVTALGGRLTVESPMGGGTSVRAEIPCESS